MEQKVWLHTAKGRLYPNFYVVLVGTPGAGKSNTIMKSREMLATLPDFKLSPNDMTKASMVDELIRSKRNIHYHVPHINDEFHSMTIMFDEWGTLLSSYEGDMIPTLTTWYDGNTPYEHTRRFKDTRISIPRPQLSIIAGSTPSNLLRCVPDFAWDQGFTSRLMLVFSGERNLRDDFASPAGEIPEDLLSDLKTIFTAYGGFEWTETWRSVVDDWRHRGEEPKPTHPKLVNYLARRRAHLYKLAMVAALDTSDRLLLTEEHFQIAKGWLEEVEKVMPEVFTTGAASVDSRLMDEIAEFVGRQGKPVSENRILRFASDICPVMTLIKVLHIMQASGRLKQVGDDPITFVKGD